MANPALRRRRRSATPANNGSDLSEQERIEIAELTNIIDRRVARRIRKQRLKSGMTLQALAQDIGVAFQQAHKYERGQSRVSAGRLFHIARVLGAPITYFFQADDEPHASEQPALPDRADRPPSNSHAFLGDRSGATATLFALAMSLSGFAGVGLDAAILSARDWELRSRYDHSSAWVGKDAAIGAEPCVAAFFPRSAATTCGLQDKTLIGWVN